MKMSEKWQDALAIAVLFCIMILFFGRLVFGEVLIQSDIIQYKGMSAEIQQQKEATGHYIHWTNSMFGGMPTYLMNDGIFMSNNIAHFTNHVIRTVLPGSAGILFIGLVCAFIFAQSLKINRWLSVMAAFGFSLGSFVVISMVAGHNSKINAYAWAPLILAGIVYCFRNKPWLGIFSIAFGLAAQLSANHLQITFYTFIVALCLFASELFFTNRAHKNILNPILFSVFGVIIALGVNFNQLATIYKYSKSTTRGGNSVLAQETSSDGLDYDYATQWSYQPLESFTLAIPNFMGGSSSEHLGQRSQWANEQQLPKSLRENPPTYWGQMPFTGGPVYIGAVYLALFFFALFILPNRQKWWAVIAACILLLLSWGKYSFLYNGFFHFFPLFNKFRTPMMALLLLGPLIPIIGCLGLDKYMKQNRFEQRPIFIGFGITIGLIILFGFLLSGGYSFTGAVDAQLENAGFTTQLLKKLRIDRAMLLREDAIRSLLFVLSLFAALYFFAKGKMQNSLFLALVGLVAFLDLYTVNKRYLKDENFESKEQYAQRFAPNAVDEAILKDNGTYRVFNLAGGNPFAEATTSNHHFSIGGYHAAKLQSYQDVIDAHLSKNNQNVLNALNTKYYIGRDSEGNLGYQENDVAHGNAWFVNNIISKSSKQEELEAIGDEDLKTTAILSSQEQMPRTTSFDASKGSIELTKYSPENMEYNATVEGNSSQFAVFSEIYYHQKDGDGWQAFINGRQVPLYRTDFLLRGIEIPPGKHVVEMKYSHAAFAKRGWVSKLFSAFLLLCGILYMKEEFIDKRKLSNAR